MKNGGSPIYTGEEGREVTRYAMAAYRSAREGRDVYLDEITSAAEETTSSGGLPENGRHSAESAPFRAF